MSSPIGMPDFSRATALAMARLCGRPFWQARYRDGRIVSEWERDWLDLSRKGLVALRLVCPNGQVGQVGNDEDAAGRLFQFKVATANVGAGGAPSARRTAAYVIGIRHGENDCTLFAWEAGRGVLVGPIADRFHGMAYGGGVMARPNVAVLGAKD